RPRSRISVWLVSGRHKARMIAAPITGRTIRARPQAHCYVCGAPGQTLYGHLCDRLYDAPGMWRLVKCTQSDCGLAWLDPMPFEEDIGHAYASYFNWPYHLWTQLGCVYRLLLRPIGLYDLRQRANMMYLDHVKPGRLLDVGCGDGRWLAHMRAHGWHVEGQELDTKAADVARARYGLPVRTGYLSELSLPEDTYDAIVLSHVIEHVHDPLAMLRECKRILKPGGSLVAITPNIDSYGQRRFGSNWVALDPPRHLLLFTLPSFQQVATQVGFARFAVWSTPVRAQFIATASLDIQRTGRHKLEARYALTQLIKATLFEWQA
ncbi:MAG: hypothetical protein C4294_19905, partial [Nitrospiraceae bacterium]